MSIKDLFDKYTHGQFQKAVTLESGSLLVESAEYIDSKQTQFDRFVPNIDYKDPKQFAKFGSAELYYENSFKRIYQQYPYDGTLAEKIEFENSSSFLDTYVLDNLYPRTNGFATFSVTKEETYTESHNGNSNPSTKEYVKITGGPHTASNGMIGKTIHSTFDNSMLYHEADRRGSSLEIDMGRGTTIEFWMHKSSSMTGRGGVSNRDGKEVIFDLWNGEVTGSTTSGTAANNDAYGRLILFLSSSDDSLHLTFKSGSNGFEDQHLLSNAFDGSWHHYALTLKESSTGTRVNLFKDNKRVLSTDYITGGVGNIVGLSSGVNATIGGNISAVSGNVFDGTDMEGWNKLSGSVDEFRFWKKARTHEEIDNTWFIPVGGGTNKYDSNIDLGFYYKFNEGITEDSSIDYKVLDYSGRITDGIWYGYQSNSRNTGSAMVSSGVTLREFKDPIIYSSHPEVSSSQAMYKTSGSLADTESTSQFYRLFPNWMQETDTENGKNLKHLSQIMGSYFDTLWHQINYVNKIHQDHYISGSEKPLPFSKNLVYSKGFAMPNLFIDASITERLRAKDDNETFEKELDEVRNIVYHNLYNNLINIYKSKGTEKSYRNFFRSLGISDEIVKLKLYADDSTYVLRDNYKYKSYERNYLNCNFEGNFGASVHQTSSVINAATYISGSPEYSSITLETEIILPRKARSDEVGYLSFPDLSASVAGFDRALPQAEDYTRAGPARNFGIYIIKERNEEELLPGDRQRIKFALSGSYNRFITSSFFSGQYENNKWNVALRIKHNNYPFSSHVTGATGAGYTYELYGIESDANIKRNSFYITGSDISAHDFVTSRKRVWSGAYKENFTGSLVTRTDIKLGYTRLWTSYLTNNAIDQHAYDSETFGSNESFEKDSIFIEQHLDIPRQKTLALHWAFLNKTGSDSNGEMLIDDLSSGSATAGEKYGKYAGVIGKLNRGKVIAALTSSTKIIDKNFVYSARKRQPDDLYSSDLVTIKDDQNENFFVDDDVSDNFYSFEKSLYGTISDEMLNMFSTALDFNNLIGQPNQRYHHEYHKLTSMKQRFFDDVENSPDLEKYTSFYKWIDDSISVALRQLYPASSRFSANIRNIVESHVLERNKYVNKIPIIARRSSTEGAARGVNELLYDWETGHAPIGFAENSPEAGSEKTNCLWITERKSGSSDTAERIRKIKNNHNLQSSGLKRTKTDGTVYFGSTYAMRKLAKPYRFKIEKLKTEMIHGGINYTRPKNRLLINEALQPHGDVESIPPYWPKNILLIGEDSAAIGNVLRDAPHMIGDGVIQKIVCDDVKNPNKKVKLNFGVKVGNKFSEKDGYEHFLKGDLIVPFNLFSGNVRSGYNRHINEFWRNNAILTNLHTDTIDNTNEIPIQGPFTRTHVGGHQSRHIDINKYDSTKPTHGNIVGLDSARSRAEAWGLALGEIGAYNFTHGTGAAGFVGADYGGYSYPNEAKLRAVRFRDEHAKRPLNIRNIQYTTASYFVGNYRKGYEIFMIQSADQKRWFRDAVDANIHLPEPILNELPNTTNYTTLIAQGVFPDANDPDSLIGSTFNASSSIYKNAKDFASPRTDLTKSTHEVNSRFSAPGGPEVQSVAFLDSNSQSFSVYNALPYRNLKIRGSGSGESGSISSHDHQGRRRGLQSLLKTPMGKFGTDDNEDIKVGRYALTGTFSKQHRNNRRRYEYSASVDGSDPNYPEQYNIVSRSVNDNGFLNTPIPGSELQYSWINAALSGSNWIVDQEILGYTRPDGLRSSSVGWVPAIIFNSGSDIRESLTHAAHHASSVNKLMFVPFIGLNTFIIDSSSADTNQIGILSGSFNGGKRAFNPSAEAWAIDNLDKPIYENPYIYKNDEFDLFRNRHYFAALNLHRNGPYGFSTWKQLRISENSVTRHHNSNSDMTFITEPGRLRNASPIGGEIRLRDRQSSVHRFKEPPVTKKTFPLLWNVGRHRRVGSKHRSNKVPSHKLERFSLLASYANNLLSFSNKKTNRLLKYEIDTENEQYEFVKNFYLDGELEEADSPFTHWEFLRYRETIYPQAKNMYRAEIRGRQNFESYYKSRRSLRTKLLDPNAFGHGTVIRTIAGTDYNIALNCSQSTWLLDSEQDFLTRDTGLDNNGTWHSDFYLPDDIAQPNVKSTIGGAGILQNNYTQYCRALHGLTSIAFGGNSTAASNAAVKIDFNMNPSPFYSRRQSLPFSQSVSNPSGLIIPETGSHIAGNTYDGYLMTFQGQAEFEAAGQAGKPPFPDSYEDFASNIRLKGQNYSVVPEFRMSEHVENILTTGSQYFPEDLFQVTGAVKYDSSFPDFYKTYSNSEFMRHFEVINDDHKEFSKAQVLTLRCKVMKKFMPYEGFYPSQRTVQLAKQFQDSYFENVTVPNLGDVKDTSGQELEFAKQSLMNPLFAPGNLYNTIKAGVACDFPVATGSIGDTNNLKYRHGDFDTADAKGRVGYYLDCDLHKRIPFEALLQPEKHLSNLDLFSMEPHPSGNLSASCRWDGGGDRLYKMMAGNFFAEVPEFFLKNKNFTVISSLPQGDPNFGKIEPDKQYGMRVKMYRSMTGEPHYVTSSANFMNTSLGSKVTYLTPQDIHGSGRRETLTMYSRPSAFGPPTLGVTVLKINNGSNNVFYQNPEPETLNSRYFKDLTDASKPRIKMDSAHGYNYPFTPPYYHGESWLDIYFTAQGISDIGGTITIDDIFQDAEVVYSRFDADIYGAGDFIAGSERGPQSLPRINQNAMQLSASIHPFSKIALSKDGFSEQTSENRHRWVIQTKFETPILNFNHISADSGNLSIPTFGSESVPRGMWHQYGKIPEENEGVYLQVGPIPDDWLMAKRNLGIERARAFGDLTEVVGFDNTPVKLGVVAETKTVYEAVVAVPFIIEEGRRVFFELNERAVRGYINREEDSPTIGLSVKNQIIKMRKYIFPPTFDFINNEDVDPIAMYIFEFSHKLDREDLSDIWQNLPPKIGTTFEEASVRITHPLLTKELLGGADHGSNKPHELPVELRWMVFKVKQRAHKNYFKKIANQTVGEEFEKAALPGEYQYTPPMIRNGGYVGRTQGLLMENNLITQFKGGIPFYLQQYDSRTGDDAKPPERLGTGATSTANAAKRRPDGSYETADGQVFKSNEEYQRYLINQILTRGDDKPARINILRQSTAAEPKKDNKPAAVDGENIIEDDAKPEQDAMSDFRIAKPNLPPSIDPITLLPGGQKPNEHVQYNWPYDYFSLVELALIDADVEWVQNDFNGYIEIMPEPKPRQTPEINIGLGNRGLENSVTVPGGVPDFNNEDSDDYGLSGENAGDGDSDLSADGDGEYNTAGSLDIDTRTDEEKFEDGDRTGDMSDSTYGQGTNTTGNFFEDLRNAQSEREAQRALDYAAGGAAGQIRGMLERSFATPLGTQSNEETQQEIEQLQETLELAKIWWHEKYGYARRSTNQGGLGRNRIRSVFYANGRTTDQYGATILAELIAIGWIFS